MNLEDIRALARLVSDSNLSEIEIEEKGVRIRIRGPHPVEVQTVASVMPPVNSPTPLPAAPTPVPEGAQVEEAQAEAGETEDETPAGWKRITSPMVGTFYRAPSPESDPFVHVGDAVRPDTTLCIVEAMKLMNEIKAEMAGIVRKILVENAQPVEFGQPIFLIEPA